MTSPTLLGLDLLPAPAISLLAAFQAANPGASVRVWRSQGGAWQCVYPDGAGVGHAGDGPDGRGASSGAGPGGAGNGGPSDAAVRHSLPVPEGVSLEVEVGGIQDGPELKLLVDALGTILRYDREARSAARELAERYEEINLLYSISEILGSVLSFAEASARILEEVAELMGAQRASLWVYDPADQRLHLAASVGADGISGPVPVDDPNSVTAQVFRERQTMNLERDMPAPLGTRLEPRPQEFEPFLSVPIHYTPPEGGTRTVGVITLVGHRNDIRFSAGDARLLAAIASQVGAALETHRLVAESLRRERVVRELELAHDLQLKLLPHPSGFEPTAQVAARCAPADSVGGDFYHLFRLSGDRVGVVIGDVSGHGFSAALIMALTMSAVGIYAREAGPPGEVLRRVHSALIDELESTEMYLTLFYGVLEPGRRRLVYANAGHPHAFFVRADGAIERLETTGPPLGTLPAEPEGEATAAWLPGEDLLFLFTDGLSDAFSAGAAGGEEVLLERVLRLRKRTPEEILHQLFRAAPPQSVAVPPDDRTAVLVR